MKMNRTNTAGRILALLLTALMVLSLAACGTKGGDKMDGMSSEPKISMSGMADSTIMRWRIFISMFVWDSTEILVGDTRKNKSSPRMVTSPYLVKFWIPMSSWVERPFFFLPI